MKCTINRNPYAVETPAHVGVSGGRTSGYLAWHIFQATKQDPDVHYVFTNTGFEHPKTIEFLIQMRDRWQLPIVALEYDHPCNGTGPDSGATVKVLERLEDCSIDGSPFLVLLDAIYKYRIISTDKRCATCNGSGTITDDYQEMLFMVKCGDCMGTGERQQFSPIPSPAQRTCTAYLKEKTANKHFKNLGVDDRIFIPGLRADEPRRVTKARVRGDVCPLADAGVTKMDVLDWWRRQPFDLEINDIMGNCGGCFLKQEGKLRYIAHYHPEILQPWADIEAQYKDSFRRDRVSYQRLIEIGASVTDAHADAWIAPSTQESMFGLADDSMPCNCTD